MEGHPACEKLNVGLISLEICMCGSSISSSNSRSSSKYTTLSILTAIFQVNLG